MTKEKPVLNADEVFAVDEKVRWVGLASSDKGDVLLNQMRQGVHSYSTPEIDDEFAALGPLTTLGVCERYSESLRP